MIPTPRILMTRRTPIVDILQEAGGALRDPFTYSLRRNRLALVGLVWGLPIPFVALAIDLYARGAPLSWASVAEAVVRRPVHVVLLAHPALFAWIFGLLGTVQRRRADRMGTMIDDLRLLARTDDLTELANHRVLHETVAAELDRARRQGVPLSVLMLDIDDFKAFNDRWGHPVGDRILAELARRLREPLRPYDVAARYGGEEFAIVLPGADADEALRIAERVRESVSRAPFPVRGGRAEDRVTVAQGVTVTVSVGIATYPCHGACRSSLLEAADLALYRAKAAGKNCVSVATRLVLETSQAAAKEAP